MGRHGLPHIEDIICGTAVNMVRTCGKAGCRCQKGHKHKSMYISWYNKGAARMVYIPKGNEKTILRLVENYRILKSAMRRASEANITRLSLGKKRGNE